MGIEMVTQLRAGYFVEGLGWDVLESPILFQEAIRRVEDQYPEGYWSYDPWLAREEALASR